MLYEMIGVVCHGENWRGCEQGLTVREQVRPGRLSEVKEYDMTPAIEHI
jgi:hypothetical protein